jgi:hypothetical protein
MRLAIVYSRKSRTALFEQLGHLGLSRALAGTNLGFSFPESARLPERAQWDPKSFAR